MKHLLVSTQCLVGYKKNSGTVHENDLFGDKKTFVMLYDEGISMSCQVMGSQSLDLLVRSLHFHSMTSLHCTPKFNRDKFQIEKKSVRQII